MQHLDEGTIHSWLDGALSADESTRVAAHVAECPQCAAAVAEARGFIAASSRILTALDHVPRGVMPVMAPVKWHNRAAWRAAAAVLVVAVGSLVVLRNGGNKTPEPSFTLSEEADTAPIPKPALPIIVQGNPSRGKAIGNSQPSAAANGKRTAKTPAADTLTATEQTSAALAPGINYSASAQAPASQTNIPLHENKAVAGQAGGAVTGNISMSSGNIGRAAPTPEALSPIKLRGATALDAAGEQFPLKVVGNPRKLGVKVTLYEVAPGDTVTFTEPVSLQLNAVVVTGVGTEERVARQSAKKAAAAPVKRADAAAASAPDSQRPAEAAGVIAPAPSAPVSATRVEVANGVTTISWPDPATGSVLTLSGRMPEARLQQIKIRIEQERAAAAKKKP